MIDHPLFQQTNKNDGAKKAKQTNKQKQNKTKQNPTKPNKTNQPTNKQTNKRTNKPTYVSILYSVFFGFAICSCAHIYIYIITSKQVEIQWLKSRWHSPCILVYRDPLLISLLVSVPSSFDLKEMKSGLFFLLPRGVAHSKQHVLRETHLTKGERKLRKIEKKTTQNPHPHLPISKRGKWWSSCIQTNLNNSYGS